MESVQVSNSDVHLSAVMLSITHYFDASFKVYHTVDDYTVGV